MDLASRIRSLRTNSSAVAVFSMFAAFATYFCMYAFRKPFTVGLYEGQRFLGIDYKVVLIIAQVAGYALAKLTGIKLISEMPPGRRIVAILVFMGTAEAGLILFGLIPSPWNFFCMFFNGLGLGFIWGIVFSFVEGRRFTEMLGAGLCTSFILASGVVKSVGRSLVHDFGVSEFWMPALTGLIFTIPLLVSVWLLSRVPSQSPKDIAHRTLRRPMSAADRREFFLSLAPGLVLLVGIYAALNAYRDFRDNFAVELWNALGYEDAPAIFSLSEIPIAVIVLVAAAFMVLIKNNQRAFWVSLGTVLVGAGIVGGTTLGFELGVVDPTLWLIAVGLGVYIPYIAYHIMIFERLIAVFRRESNIGFLMYIADTFGYVASIGVMLYRDFGARKLSWIDFYVGASYAMAIGCAVVMGAGMLYFRRRLALRDRSSLVAGVVRT